MKQQQARQEILFALSQLGPQNRHHGFEDLARTLARETVSANLLPATGPVSAGGDQGRDFETFRTRHRHHVRLVGYRMGVQPEDAIAFCCTTQQKGVTGKFEHDIQTVLGSGVPVQFVVAYCNSDMAVKARHAFQRDMRNKYGQHVEVFDAQAVAELLAQPEYHWIAEEYLHVRALPDSGINPTPEWYAQALADWRQDAQPPYSLRDLAELRQCFQAARESDAGRRDLPFWIDRMRAVASAAHTDTLAHKARFEIVLTHLRTWHQLRGAEDDCATVITTAATSDDPDRLSDAASLLIPAGAFARSDGPIIPDQVASWGDLLSERIAQLLAEPGLSPGRLCQLREGQFIARMAPSMSLMTSHELLDERTDEPVGEHPAGQPTDPLLDVVNLGRGSLPTVDEYVRMHRHPLPRVDVPGAMSSVQALLRQQERAPLFPLSRVSDLVRIHEPELRDLPGYREVVTTLDARLADQQARKTVADRAWERAQLAMRDGRRLDALQDLASAREAWLEAGYPAGLAHATLSTAIVYSRLGLSLACKYYAMLTLYLLGQDDADLVSAAFHVLADAEYELGSWITAAHFGRFAYTANVVLPGALSPGDGVDMTALQEMLEGIAWIAEEVGGDIEACVRHELDLPEPDPELPDPTDDTHDASTPEAVAPPDAAGATPDEQEADGEDANARAVAELLATGAFDDCRAERSIRWEALGSRWEVHYANDPETLVVGERFVCALQIVLAAATRTDLLLVPQHVTIHLHALAAHETPQITGSSGQGGPTFRIGLGVEGALTGTQTTDETPTVAHTTIVAIQFLLGECSLLRQDDFCPVFTSTLEAGVLRWTYLAASYDTVFDHVQGSAPLSLAGSLRVPLRPDPGFRSQASELDAPSGPGPGYTPEQGRQMAANRYAFVARRITATLRGLRTHPPFWSAARDLRAEGFLEWHIAVAVYTVAFNTKHEQALQADPEAVKRLSVDRLPPVEENGQAAPLNLFSLDALRQACEMNMYATLNVLGLRATSGRCDPNGVRALLAARFGYLTDDAPHEALTDPDSSIDLSQDVSTR